MKVEINKRESGGDVKIRYRYIEKIDEIWRSIKR